MKRALTICTLAMAALWTGRADAAVRITEWMYSGGNGEFIEFTNTGATPVDLTGWSYTDSARTAGQVSLAPLGVIAAGESFIVTETAAPAFRTAWNLPLSVKVLGDNIVNLGRADEVNIYNGTTLVDRLTYDDQGIAGSIRTQNKSGIPSSLAALGANNVLQWQLAVAGDSFGSATSVGNDVGNPGRFTLVPEPATLALAGLGAVAIASLRRRSR